MDADNRGDDDVKRDDNVNKLEIQEPEAEDIGDEKLVNKWEGKDLEDYQYIQEVIIKQLEEQQEKDGISMLGDVNLLHKEKK